MAMTHRIEPILNPVPIKDLRPTQMTVGLREVTAKRTQWRKVREAGGEFLGHHMIPAVLGPGDTWWIIDHHHLARALHDEGVEHVLISTVAKLNHLKKKRFFTVMDCHNWIHAYDSDGKRCDWDALPRHIGKMVDDPYRSLAGEVRAGGGYAKSPTPYTEFLWADYFRDRIRRSHVEAKFDKILPKAIGMARSVEAAYLPGYSGPDHHHDGE
jgi:hypothetical protein